MALKDYLEEGYEHLLDAYVRYNKPEFSQTEIMDPAVWAEVALILTKMRYVNGYLDAYFEGNQQQDFSPPSIPDEAFSF